jgi:hypothetical protein
VCGPPRTQRSAGGQTSCPPYEGQSGLPPQRDCLNQRNRRPACLQIILAAMGLKLAWDQSESHRLTIFRNPPEAKKTKLPHGFSPSLGIRAGAPISRAGTTAVSITEGGNRISTLLGACRRNPKSGDRRDDFSHFGLASLGSALVLWPKWARLWAGHPTFSRRQYFSDRLLERAV